MFVGGGRLLATFTLVISNMAFTNNVLAGAGRGMTFGHGFTHGTAFRVSNTCDGPTNLT